MWIEIKDWWLSFGVEYVAYADLHIIFTPLLIAAIFIINKAYKKYVKK